VSRLVPSGRIQRFPSDPVERKARRIFCLVSRQIPTEKSSGAHFPAIEGATLGEDTFGVPERSSDQIQGNPSDPFHSRPRAISLRHLSADSDGGITRAQFSSSRGGAFPQGDPSGVQTHQQRVDWSVTRTERESRAHCLGQFPGRSESLATRANFPDLQQLSYELS
jgi:hypothetical protein